MGDIIEGLNLWSIIVLLQLLILLIYTVTSMIGISMEEKTKIAHLLVNHASHFTIRLCLLLMCSICVINKRIQNCRNIKEAYKKYFFQKRLLCNVECYGFNRKNWCKIS